MPIFQPSMMKRGGGDAGSLTPSCCATSIRCMRWRISTEKCVILHVPTATTTTITRHFELKRDRFLRCLHVSRSVTWLAQVTASTAPPSSSSSGRPLRGRRRRRRGEEARGDCVACRGPRHSNADSQGGRGGRRGLPPAPLEAAVDVDSGSGIFMAGYDGYDAFHAVFLRAGQSCLASWTVWTRMTVFRSLVVDSGCGTCSAGFTGIAPRAVFLPVFVRPLMLGIMAGMNQRDSYASRWSSTSLSWRRGSVPWS